MKSWAGSKFGLLLGAFLVLTGLTFWDGGLENIYTAHGGSRVCFYLTAGESLNLQAFSGVVVTKNGNGVIVDAPGDAARRIRGELSNIKGESVSFDGDTGDARGILSRYAVRTVFEEEIPMGGEGSINIIYGFSASLTRSVNLDGKKVNIQIAVNSESGRVTVGTPLILGSY